MKTIHIKPGMYEELFGDTHYVEPVRREVEVLQFIGSNIFGVIAVCKVGSRIETIPSNELEIVSTVNNVLYLCDRKACTECSYPTCKYTADIEHAVNFKKEEDFYTEEEK